MSDKAANRKGSGEAGFTIIEVMVAMVILIIGALGTVILVEGGMSSTASTAAREQGTNLARDLVERSRQFSFASMTTAAAPATASAPATPGAPTVLRNALPASDNATAVTGTAPLSKFEITRRGTTYTVTVFACSVDDPTDGIGVGDATFCAGSNGVVAPGTPAPGVAASINVLGLGIPLAFGGSLLQTVCNATGPGNPITPAVSSLVSKIAPISVCPTPVSGTSNVAYDATPDDLRRVRIDVKWTSRSGRLGSVSQTTLLTNPLQT